MFWQRRNETRASRSCKVGQLGLEQLDARVVPSTVSPSQPDVAFDELGNIKGGKEVEWDKLSHKTQDALEVKGIEQDYVYKLDKAINLKKEYGDDDIWVKITEPSKKDDHSGKDYGKPKEKTSDILHIVTVHKKDDSGWNDKDDSRSKGKDVTYVSVFSDKEKGEDKDHFDVGLPKVKKFDVKAEEKGPEDHNFAKFTVEEGKKDVDFLFVSDGKLKTDRY